MKYRFFILFFFVAAMMMFGCDKKQPMEPAPNPDQQLEQARNATAKYLDIKQAFADGYANIHVVVPKMGHHYLKSTWLDATFDHQRPELLVYAAIPDTNHLQLVAVEYAVPTNLAATPPEGFDGKQDEWDRNDTFGLWTLHAWVWLPNPDGVFADTNPRLPN